MQPTEYEVILQETFPFWGQLSKEQKELMIKNTMTVQYPKGEQLHRGSLDCIGVLLVQSGQFRTYLLSEDGKDITLYRLSKGEVCLLTASCILKEITFDVFVDAEEDSTALLVPAAVFRQVTQQNIHAQVFEYQLRTSRFSDVMWAMQQILFMSFDKRLAIFLIDELAKTGGDTVRLTHEQIAKYMGSAREVVTRMLKYFANEGIVTLSRGAVTVTDREKLRKLTN